MLLTSFNFYIALTGLLIVVMMVFIFHPALRDALVSGPFRAF
jgi:hypothetical protein